jgi:UDP-N-acetylglucosamine 2-epimerase (non-hydrolysing)
VGDVNSTLACALTAAKLQIKVAHVEAGLRSFDRAMPEEINRVATDAVSDLLFVSEPSGVKHLQREGIPEGRMFLVGNVMIDTLLHSMPKIDQSDIVQRFGLQKGGYAAATLHRPSNVDTRESLEGILEIFSRVTRKLPVVYPVHPRTRARMRECGLEAAFAKLDRLRLIDPLGYVDFVALVKDARLVMTDSGGIQEETTVLRVPCLTMRENTERPITVEEGTNRLVGTDKAALLAAVEDVLAGRWQEGRVPFLWDGRAALRIANVLAQQVGTQAPQKRPRRAARKRLAAATATSA